MKTQFSHIIIIGVGLLGGSVGLAVKRTETSPEVIGIDCSLTALTLAKKRNILDEFSTDLAATIQQVSRNADSVLVLIAIPVGRIAQKVLLICELIRQYSSPKTFWLITDVGSTKEEILQEVKTCSFPVNTVFIGSHPIAGSDKSGPESAMATLFDDKITLLTPGETPTTSGAFKKLEQFWKALGSQTFVVDARLHDQILARTSHLPHLISVLLSGLIESEDLPFIGTGYRDMTRLAHSNPDVWTDILSINRHSLLDALLLFEQSIHEWKQILQANDRERIHQLLAQSRSRQNSIQ